MYNRTFWLDHVVDGDGRVIQQGTNLSQDNFNKLELGVFENGVEQNINAILANLNARESAQAEPVAITGVAVSTSNAFVSIPVGKTRNVTNYVVVAMVTSGNPGNIVIGTKQANGFNVTAEAAGTVTFIVMGGML